VNVIPNRQAICETLMQCAREDDHIVVLCSDSRGSASLAPFADAFPERFVETGIAEQNPGGYRCGPCPMRHEGIRGFSRLLSDHPQL